MILIIAEHSFILSCEKQHVWIFDSCVDARFYSLRELIVSYHYQNFIVYKYKKYNKSVGILKPQTGPIKQITAC